jgi:hypothetical protein
MHDRNVYRKMAMKRDRRRAGAPAAGVTTLI